MVISQDKTRAIPISRTPASSSDRLGIDANTWELVEEAILERVEAVELFLADVAGKFRIRSRLESIGAIGKAILDSREHLVTALPSFQRRVWLGAIDLCCDTEGQMWIVDDHYCCPYGLYTYSRLLTELNNSKHTQTFEQFTRAARNSIQPFLEDDATAVVLGSSTFNTTYRENQYFAEFLNLPYVQQRQLEMQRQGLVESKASAGRKVSAVIRRLQDDDLDPNCFRAESLQGVRGLVRGARRGLVTVLNAPGTGMFNSRQVSRLIPQIIRFYFGKEPALPTVPTIDARDHSARAAEAMNMSEYIFRTDNSMDVLKPFVAENSSRDQMLNYLKLLEANPGNFVIRRTLDSICGGQVTSAYSLRAFCVGTSERTVLRGGIRRSCHSDGTPCAPIPQDQTASIIGVD